MDNLNTENFFHVTSEINYIHKKDLSLQKNFNTNKIKKSWTNFLDFKNMKYSQLIPANKNEKIFFANYTGTVKAINIYTGTKIWEINLNNLFIPHKKNIKLAGGIGVSSSDINYIYMGSEYGIIYALDINNGKLIWKQKTLGKILSIPQSTNYGVLIIYTNNGFLQALNEIDGSIQWTKKINNEVFNTYKYDIFFVKIFSDKVILIDNKKNVIALSVYNGETIWEQSINYIDHKKNNLFYSINEKKDVIVLDNKIYVISKNGYLFCLNSESGKILWINKSIYISKILYDKNNLYAIDQYYKIIAINLHTGENVWIYNQKLIRPNYRHFAIYHKYFIFLDQNKYVYQININNRKYIKKEKINISGNIFFMNIFKNYLLIIAKSGKIYSFNL
ncbi:outer membrane protein assembly factor BamB family protein [Wigglesworthia glossinidia]|nr:PQQ-binding-like beta-propeller repeat protein [Wigglesworthia glossinidia]